MPISLRGQGITTPISITGSPHQLHLFKRRAHHTQCLLYQLRTGYHSLDWTTFYVVALSGMAGGIIKGLAIKKTTLTLTWTHWQRRISAHCSGGWGSETWTNDVDYCLCYSLDVRITHRTMVSCLLCKTTVSWALHNKLTFCFSCFSHLPSMPDQIACTTVHAPIPVHTYFLSSC